MSTIIRPELSKKSPYWLPKDRMYELKYFVKQYPTWQETYRQLAGLSTAAIIDIATAKKSYHGSMVEEKVEIMTQAKLKIDMINKALSRIDPIIGPYVLKGIIYDHGYSYLKTTDNIPCSKEYYYAECRRFFWELSTIRR